MSRITIFSMLLAIMITAGIHLWAVDHPDDCARYLAGDRSLPSIQMVDAGPRRIEVSCKFWVPRQPMKIQLWWLGDGALLVLFALNSGIDLRDAWRRRRRERLIS